MSVIVPPDPGAEIPKVAYVLAGILCLCTSWPLDTAARVKAAKMAARTRADRGLRPLPARSRGLRSLQRRSPPSGHLCSGVEDGDGGRRDRPLLPKETVRPKSCARRGEARVSVPLRCPERRVVAKDRVAPTTRLWRIEHFHGPARGGKLWFRSAMRRGGPLARLSQPAKGRNPPLAGVPGHPRRDFKREAVTYRRRAQTRTELPWRGLLPGAQAGAAHRVR